jgi:hypothetical protein
MKPKFDHMTIQEFIDTNKVSFTCKLAYSNPNMDNDKFMTRHFKCIIRYENRRMVVYFSQGSAHTQDPTCADVLDCMSSDCGGIDLMGQGEVPFEDWCAEYGYDTDSISAARTYKAVTKQGASILRVFGDDKLVELLRCERM